jgi:hypothetical protein
MTYDQAIAQGYRGEVEAVGKVGCDFTGRLMDSPDVVEFSASHSWVDPQGDRWTITAYYEQDQADVDRCEDGDLGELDWVPCRYEVV